ncbi:MAG TPA: hypothetical protein VHG30_02580 [Microvirga sp.]|nr:hypothetical protein [Microvirga sp.]
MFSDTIRKLADTGLAEARVLTADPLGFWISSMMAGICKAGAAKMNIDAVSPAE